MTSFATSEPRGLLVQFKMNSNQIAKLPKQSFDAINANFAPNWQIWMHCKGIIRQWTFLTPSTLDKAPQPYALVSLAPSF